MVSEAEYLLRTARGLCERAERLGLGITQGGLTEAQLRDLEEAEEAKQRLYEEGDFACNEAGELVHWTETEREQRLVKLVDKLVKVLGLKPEPGPEKEPQYIRIATKGGKAGAQGGSWTGRVLHSTKSLGG